MSTSTNAGNSSSAQLRSLHPAYHQQNPRRIPSMQWLFRSNIPRHRRSLLGPDLRKRNVFGVSEILNVFTSVSPLRTFIHQPSITVASSPSPGKHSAR